MTRLSLSSADIVVELTPGQSATLGRGVGSTIVSRSERASRRHAIIEWDDGWVLVDQGSTNGTFVGGIEVERHVLADGDTITLGTADGGEGGVTVHLAEVAVPTSLSTTLIIGRGAGCDIVVPDLGVSREHARVTRDRGTATIEDLHSANGTFVNGSAIARTELKGGDRISVGQSTFAVSATGSLDLVSDGTASALTVSSVTYALPHGQVLLNDVTFSLPSSSLTAVIGPSGAGKSTLFRAITGHLTPNAGAVTYQGLDLHRHFDGLRHRIGVVPQDDVIHRSLTVRQALTYAAELRFPSDVEHETRVQRVRETVDELGLTAHLDTRVARLSGGQRKRTSVAMELLTRPSLLLLDEPTSGLDAGLEHSVMANLRALADGGRTVVVITHGTDSLRMCDKVVALAPGGRVAYSGPSAQLLPHFDTTEHHVVFHQLAESGGDVGTTSRAAVETPPPLPPIVDDDVAPTPPRRDGTHQLLTLVRRQARLLITDRSHAAFNLAMPLVLALLALAVPGDAGLGLPVGEPTNESMQLLVVLVVGAIFTGMAATIRDLVQERTIYERERDVGLDPSAYLMSKLIVLGALTALQAVVMTSVVLLVKPGPADGVILPGGDLELVLVIALTAVVAAVTGLCASAVVTTSEQVMPILVVAVMAQLVLSGGIFPVAGRAGLAQIALLAPSRWGYAGAASIVDVDAVTLHPPEDGLWQHTAGHLLLAVAVLAVMGVALAAFTRWRLEDPRTRRPIPGTPRRHR